MKWFAERSTTVVMLLVLALFALVAFPTIHHLAGSVSHASGSLGLVGGFAVMGVMRDLGKESYIHKSKTYGPGMVDVPETFPDLDEKGKVIFASTSRAASNQDASRRVNDAPPPIDRDSSRALTHTVSGRSHEELSKLKKEDLKKLAEELSLTVVRGDGDETKEPLLEDYVTALSAPV